MSKLIRNKGPFKITKSGHPDFNYCVVAPDGGSICHMTGYPMTELGDAHMFAAAPEMLEYLIELCIKSIKLWKDNSGEEGFSFDEWKIESPKIVKIIEKATGKKIGDILK